ncbi:MAG: helix-turn-helix transcriptional regulator [Deltaproteobacteria bacterium]|nr:helix-turn-helix transcriptional regulator [Deltaproteobacteria bacterium]
MPRRPDPDAREALLAAARAEFARRGLDGARIEDITRRAGLSKGAFYLHFRGKEEAFRLLVERLLGALEEQASRRHEEKAALDARLGPMGADADVLQQAIEAECRWDTAMLEVLWHNRHLVAAADAALSRPVARLLDAFRRRISATVAGNFRALQERGQMRRDLDPIAAADLVVGAYEAFGRRMAALREKPDLLAWTRTVLQVVYLGVLEPPHAAASPHATASR